MSTDQRFYIASLKHTNKWHEHVTWWGKDWRGYTLVVADVIGEYGIEDAIKLNDGADCIAVPVEHVKSLLSPEPYFRPHAPARFYDQRGPVVDNTRANWNRLIAVSLTDGRMNLKPKPEVFRGTRRSFGFVAAPSGTGESAAGCSEQPIDAAEAIEPNAKDPELGTSGPAAPAASSPSV